MTPSLLALIAAHPGHFSERFAREAAKSYLQLLFNEFVRVTDGLPTGRAQYGADMVVGVLRWHRAMAGGDDFKVSNDYTAAFARAYHYLRPGHRVFRMKCVDAELTSGKYPPCSPWTETHPELTD